jgi:hypothetical protein
VKTLRHDGRVPCQDKPQLFGAPEDEHVASAPYKARVRAARALCASCPVWQECRQLGRDLAEHDVWGGEDNRQRRRSGVKMPRYPASGAGQRGYRPAA